MTFSVGEPPASSTPSLSRSSSISAVDNVGLHTSILSQVGKYQMHILMSAIVV